MNAATNGTATHAKGKSEMSDIAIGSTWFVTRHWQTDGITAVKPDGKWCIHEGSGGIKYLSSGIKMMALYRVGRDAFPDYASAAAHCEKLKAAKLASLERQIARIKKRKFDGYSASGADRGDQEGD